MQNDELYMKKAIQLALKAKGNTSPNPLVGALIVKNNKIIGKGYHSGPGNPHAEIEALKNLKGDIKNADMYITLEPCNFYGRTPPCVLTLEKLPIKRFIIGTKDINPKVNGKSIARLRKRGFKVKINVLEDKVKSINPFYEFYMKNKETFFYMKIAQTLNGYIAKKNNKKKEYLTCLESRKFVHKMRYNFDAILVGANTINIDNPILDTRLIKSNYKPKIIILDNNNKLNYRKDIFKDENRKKIIFINKKFKKTIKFRKNIEYIFIKSKKEAWELMKYDFAQRNIISIFIEGGENVFTNALEKGMINKLGVFVAPIIFNNGISAFNINKKLSNFSIERIMQFDVDLFMEYKCLQV